MDGEQCVVQMERDGQGYVKQIQQDLGKVSSAVLAYTYRRLHCCTLFNSNVLIPCIIAKPL